MLPATPIASIERVSSSEGSTLNTPLCLRNWTSIWLWRDTDSVSAKGGIRLAILRTLTVVDDQGTVATGKYHAGLAMR